MSRITQQLLRKRAEHNEGCLTTLEEISLHQQQIKKIQNFDVLCRHIKILYLQNNIVEKMENLNKLKELEYLNLALNNISKIQNIEGCESLKKLDMTVNFIDVVDLHESVECLSKLQSLKQIYLTGNPCEQWEGCKQYIIAKVPNLECYNGQVIIPSQKIKAKQNLKALQGSLYSAVQQKKLVLKQREAEQLQRKQMEKHMTQEQIKHMKTPYSKQIRREMYQKMYDDKQKKEKQKNPQKYVQEKETPMFTKDGQIRQCNQGRFKFSLKQFQDPDYSFFTIAVPKHVETSQVIVNVDPKWVSVRIKKQLTQLKLSEQILVSESKTQRSQITGELTIKMKKVNPHQFLRSKRDMQKLKIKKQEQQKKQKQKKEKQHRVRLCQQYERRMQKQEDEIPDLE